MHCPKYQSKYEKCILHVAMIHTVITKNNSRLRHRNRNQNISRLVLSVKITQTFRVGNHTFTAFTKMIVCAKKIGI